MTDVQTTVKPVYLHASHAVYVAAALGHTNIGFSLNEIERDFFRSVLFSTARDNRKVSLSSAVMTISQNRMENDEHQTIFEDEAKGWLETAIDPEKLYKEYPRQWVWYQKMLHSDRWKHAKAALDGASNQRLLARCLAEAIVDAQQEGVNLTNDGAVQILLDQLARVLGTSANTQLGRFSDWMDQVKANCPD